MKGQIKVSRQLKEYPDGQQRWDRAYQYLLQWTLEAETNQASSSKLINKQEAKDVKDSNLYAGFHSKTDTITDN
jgi:hypothetical protein